MLQLTDNPISPAQLLQHFSEQLETSGAIISFSGIVRPNSKNGAVKTLFLEVYSPMTENGIKQAISASQDRWPLEDCLVVHRHGELHPGDDIVFVATASAHRRAAFEAADFLMDYLKTKAIFWKKETTEIGDTWIEPRAEDYNDANRWKQG